MFLIYLAPCTTHDAVPGLDPRTTQSVCRIANGPWIESVGGAVVAEGIQE
ncbi:hypothetical protein SAMN06295905_0394 [Devosia lucknowensis]|uniref:Uncharacterized protein n=1 Tax=Devosia lucknowensis TaxID=1096929 RepID=A0A1Y6EK76_9HYPH|nr:hypothetical protein SAMN06295905_0394 [Devosia lucknowensis]